MKVDKTTLEDIFDYLFYIRARKFLSKKKKRYVHNLFEKWDPEHLELNNDFDDYIDNDGLEDIIGEEGM